MRSQRWTTGRSRRWTTGTLVIAIAVGMTVVLPATQVKAAPLGPTTSKSVDRALGNGLGRLVQQSSRAQSRRVSSGPRIDSESLTIRDAEGRVLVDLTPQAGVDRADYRRRAETLGLQVQAVDARRGTLEGYIALDAVQALAALSGTGSLAQAVKPQVHVGDATSQGVALQNVDKVQAAGATGAGVTIGALSDSYDTATQTVEGDPLSIHARDDVASGDLPGVGNPQNSQPVVVLQDQPVDQGAGTDEGRGMLQIAHDVAPAAKLCFATAYTGIVGFAENIRRLADKSGACGADVIVDDITYLDEPMYSDSVLTDAIDDVAADGAHYFSAAGNSGEQQAWYSRTHLVSLKTGLKGTNLDFSDVDPALYTGGLQDMKPGSGVDVAQTLRVGADGGTVDLQWDDPIDVDGASYGAPYFTASGAVTDDQDATFSFTPTSAQRGKTVAFRTDAVPSGSKDLILSVTAPNGAELGTVDTGTSPEVLATTLTQKGAYTITVSGYDGATGPVTVDVRPQTSPSKITTDYNALFFDADGNFFGSAADLNTATGRPSEIADLAGLDETTDVQMVISRAGKGPVGATRLRTVLFGNAFVNEYANPLAPAIFGHPDAKGATAVAAYDPFKPYLPEFYTSPGGNLAIFFDSAGNRYPTLQRRKVPQIASADGGNTTFFGSDTKRDADSRPNFFGTSAAAPHAAAIAALALQKAGGPGSISPAAMRSRLQTSTFAHDLDPNYSSGTVSGLTVAASGPQGSEADLVASAMYDTRFFRASYTGKVPLRWIRFYGETASPTALGTSSSARSAGVVFDPRRFDRRPPFTNEGFPFKVGPTSGGVSTKTISAKYSLPAGTSKGQYRHVEIDFSRGLKKGQVVRFGVDRDLAVSGLGTSRDGNGADELGGATRLPSGVAQPKGMTFVAKRTDGKKITGRIVNDLGSGYTALDGYGLVDAQRALSGS